jgi:hypothetical protein
MADEGWDQLARFARLFYEDDARFEREERSYKTKIAERLSSAIKAFRDAPAPTDDDALSADQRQRYLGAATPAEAARALGVGEKRYRDLLRARDVYVSRGSPFDESIRLEILPSALLLPGARREGDWRDALKRAFGPPNNLTAWRAHDSFIKWTRVDLDTAASAVDALLRPDSGPAGAIDGFCRLVPIDVVRGRATRLAIAAFILWGTDSDSLPPFRSSLLLASLGALGDPLPADELTEGGLYEEFLRFLDEMIERCAERSLPISNRIDAQGVLWSVMSDTIERPEGWLKEDWDALLAFRAGGSQVTREADVGRTDALGARVKRFREESDYPNASNTKQLALTPTSIVDR